MIKNKKGEFGLRAYFIAMLFFGAVIIIFSLMVGSLSIEYNNEDIVNDDFTSRYSNFQEYSGRIESIRNTLSSSEGVNIINVGFGVFKATFSFIQLSLSSLGLIGTSAANFTEDFDLPFQIAGILMSVFLGIIIIIIVIKILNSLNPGKL